MQGRNKNNGVPKTVKIFTWVIFGCFMSLALAAVVGHLTHSYTLYDEQSSSMRPVIVPGDAVVMTPIPASEVHKGMIIVTTPPSPYPQEPLLHEVAIDHNGFVVTKGLTNPAYDPWRVKLPPVVWHEVLVIPYFGSMTSFVEHNPTEVALFIVAIGLALGISYIVRRRMVLTTRRIPT